MHILIVGAGTAGWSAAAALSYNKKLSISVIEPKDVPTIGVGESTLPLINRFHKDFAIFKDLQWIENASGVLKFTIDFENFFENKQHTWSHPFNINKEIESQNVLENTNLSNPELTDKFFYTQRLKNSGFSSLSSELSKIGAYHLDAKIYASELKKIALGRGVKLYTNKITQLEQSGNKTNSVTLDNGEKLTADLYIDCSGFHNILFKNLESEFIPFTQRLFCDSAVTIRLPFKDEKKQKTNATLCYALDNGWVWHTPLQDTLTMGYVFSSKHTNFDNATQEFKDYLKEKQGYEVDDLSFNKVSFRSGTYKESWLGNNIAIGLSSFFIEPIESTGIALFQIQITELSKILQSNPKFVQNYQSLYNNSVREKIFLVKDFIEMHYMLSDRKDSQFWRDSSSIEPSEKQKKIIQLYTDKEYKKILSYEIGEIFSSLSWLLLLLGMDKSKLTKN